MRRRLSVSYRGDLETLSPQISAEDHARLTAYAEAVQRVREVPGWTTQQLDRAVAEYRSFRAQALAAAEARDDAGSAG